MGFLGNFVHYFLLIISFGQSKRIANFIARLLGYENCLCDKRRNQLNNLWVKEKNKTYIL